MEATERGGPQVAGELRAGARHLLGRPLTCAEHDPEMYRLIRRHEAELDRWFTQRLGYRLHVGADTARLYKSGYVPDRRPLRTGGRSGRPLRPLEYTTLALILAATAAGPSVVSLRDLNINVRSAAAEAGVTLEGTAVERRAVVRALLWMIEQGLALELHEHVENFSNDEDADAVLQIRPDRIALLPLPGFGAAQPAPRRAPTRQWLRSRLVEDPVLYRDDCSDEEWAEIRRRLREEAGLLDEMFGLVIEARAEGIAAIDPTGKLADQPFPSTGTVGHAALLFIEQIAARTDSRPSPVEATNATDATASTGAAAGRTFTHSEALAVIDELATIHAKRWANDLVESPPRLTTRVLDLLLDLRLAINESDADRTRYRLLAAAARFTVAVDPDAAEQTALW